MYSAASVYNARMVLEAVGGRGVRYSTVIPRFHLLIDRRQSTVGCR